MQIFCHLYVYGKLSKESFGENECTGAKVKAVTAVLMNIQAFRDMTSCWLVHK